MVPIRALDTVLGFRGDSRGGNFQLEREDAVRKERIDLGDRRDSGMEGHGVYWGRE